MEEKISLKKLTQEYRLKPNQIMVYTVILKMTRKKGCYQSGYNYLAKNLNLSNGFVCNIISDLEEKGLVEIIRKKGGKHSQIKGLEA